MILDGKMVSNQIKENLKEEIRKFVKQTGITPCLKIILVGENPASLTYVKNKVKAAQVVGIDAEVVRLNENVTENALLDLINEMNKDASVHGIIVQLPLPCHINDQKVIDTVCDAKDVDGFGIENKGKLFSGLPCMESATPKGIMRLLDAYNIPISGSHAVVIGRSNIVGKPMAQLLLQKDATVTICHSRTKDLSYFTKSADILVVAIGKPKFITGDMVKEGAVVVDVGTNRVDGVMCGDVDFESVAPIASYISPVPGGVGPLTIASLLENTFEACKNITKKGDSIC